MFINEVGNLYIDEQNIKDLKKYQFNIILDEDYKIEDKNCYLLIKSRIIKNSYSLFKLGDI